MLDGAVRSELGADANLLAGFVRHQRAFLRNVGADDRNDAGDGPAVDVEGNVLRRLPGIKAMTSNFALKEIKPFRGLPVG